MIGDYRKQTEQDIITDFDRWPEILNLTKEEFEKIIDAINEIPRENLVESKCFNW